jgi:hypothetical protein
VPSWFHFRSPRPREDPSVAAVEQELDAASRGSESVPIQDGRIIAQHALAICACVTADDAPKWLIYDTADGGLMWRRVPDRMDPLGLVDAKFTAGGHADPAEVMRWLRGGASAPWGSGGDGGGNSGVLEALRERINPE